MAKMKFAEMFELQVEGRIRFTRDLAAEAVARWLYQHTYNWSKRGALEKEGIMTQHLRNRGLLSEFLQSLPHEELLVLLRIGIPEDMGDHITTVDEPEEMRISLYQHGLLVRHIKERCTEELRVLYEKSCAEDKAKDEADVQRRLADALDVVKSSGKYKVVSTEIKPPKAKLDPKLKFKAKAVKGGRVNLVMGRTPNNEEL